MVRGRDRSADLWVFRPARLFQWVPPYVNKCRDQGFLKSTETWEKALGRKNGTWRAPGGHLGLITGHQLAGHDCQKGG